MRDFNGILTHGLSICVSAAVLWPIELWRPIHSEQANLLSSSYPVKGMKHKTAITTATIISSYKICISAVHLIILFHSFHGLGWTQQIGLLPIYGSS